jgi:hypothetical protein
MVKLRITRWSFKVRDISDINTIFTISITVSITIRIIISMHTMQVRNGSGKQWSDLHADAHGRSSPLPPSGGMHRGVTPSYIQRETSELLQTLLQFVQDLLRWRMHLIGREVQRGAQRGDHTRPGGDLHSTQSDHTIV